MHESGAGVEIVHLESGSTWKLLSVGAPYGHSSSVALVDEAWAIPAEVVDDALAPTQAQRKSAQLMLVSTANRKATSLMIGRRAAALNDLEHPDRTLWLEWSAAPDAELDDREAWRAASPQCDEHRMTELAHQYAIAVQNPHTDPTEPDPLDSFGVQWLNRWRSEVEVSRKGEPYVDMDAWHAARADLQPG